MQWANIPETVDLWVSRVADLGFNLRKSAADAITGSHVGYYVHPETLRIGIFAPLVADSDAKFVKKAVANVTKTEPLFLSYQELADPDGAWVKVAYSPTLRRAGELLNFFPGQYPNGVPNNPSPVAAMLTSGLLGAGVGWGAGHLIGQFMPEGYGKKLGRTGMLLGGALGVAPGLMWGATNLVDHRNFNDPSLLSPPAGSEAINYPTSVDGNNATQFPHASLEDKPQKILEDVGHTLHQTRLPRVKFSQDLEGIQLGKRYLAAIEKVADTFGTVPEHLGSLPTDVNIDRLGRTLWDTGAPPNLAATTMAGMYAAQQLPDPRSKPGWVTGNQLGQLAANVAGDYTKGYLAGAAINTIIGTPFRNSSFGTTGAVLGVLGAVVPKLFGR